MSVSESVHGPFKKTTGSTAALHLTQIESLLIFTASCCGDSSFQYWCSELMNLVWSWDPSSVGTSTAKISLPNLNHHMRVWDQPILHLNPSYQF